MNPEMAKALRAPFPKEEINYTPKGGRMLAYVGHARVTDRLLQVDPEWALEPLAVNDNGAPVFVLVDLQRPVGLWVKLTVGGVSRVGYGTTEYFSDKRDPDAIKKILSDALRNAAMRFGVGLDLWVKDGTDDVAPATTQSVAGHTNVGVPPGTVVGVPTGTVVKTNGLPVSPSPTFPKKPDDELLGRSIGACTCGQGGQYIIKRSKTGNLYAQCNGRNVVDDNGNTKPYCNAFPAYGALDAWKALQTAGDVDPDSVPDSVGENVSVPPVVASNNHHKEFIKAAMDAEFSVARPWIKGFENDRLIALVEHIEESGKVPAATMKRLHYGDRAELSRKQLLELADGAYVAHAVATHRATQDEVEHDLEEIPF